MKEKLKQFMEANQLTAAQLADRIGVQRSSFSHVLNGRNKPSADFIGKLLDSFPEVNANWLFGNSENMYVTQRIRENTLFRPSETEPADSAKPLQSDILKQEISHSAEKESVVRDHNDQGAKKPARIVFFFSDSSFKEYIPE